MQTLRILMSGPKDRREKFVQGDFTIYEDGVPKPIGQKRRIGLRIRGVRRKIAHEFVTR